MDNLLDTTIEAADEGMDTVNSNLTWKLTDNLNNLTLTGSVAINGTGNAADNTRIDAANDAVFEIRIAG